MDTFGADNTWARDGAGIRSNPNTGFTYWLGYSIMGGTQGSVIGFIGGRRDRE
jgi:hypothetical protein